MDTKKTLVVWRQVGKEHGGDEKIRQNSPIDIAAHLQSKVDLFHETADTDWRWYMLDEQVLVERPFSSTHLNEDSRIFYLPRRYCSVIQYASFPDFCAEPCWCIYVGPTQYDASLRSWIFEDRHVRLLVHPDGKTHTVEHLDQLFETFHVGAMTRMELGATLKHTQQLIDMIRKGRFPAKEILRYQEALPW